MLNVPSMPVGRLMASECAVESPTMTSRRGSTAWVTGVTGSVVGATVVTASTESDGCVTMAGAVDDVDPVAALGSNTTSLLVSFAASNTLSADE